ncbi:MAG: PqqD family protein [Clostridium butyricum]|nr:PqqD family protein [Clostridium butyricum]MDU5821796.1 PqqD family protein [Clostridium butyricum]
MKKIMKNSAIIESIKNDELIILNMDNGNYYGLQDTSLEVWELLDKYSDEQELLQQVLMVYQDDTDSIKKEIEQFISRLHKERLIRYEEQ